MSAGSARGGLRVLHDDNHLLVVTKPAGLPTVPDATGDESLLDRAKAWVRETYRKPGGAFLGVVHRLDRPVSGVVVFARTSKAAARLAEAFRSGSVAKVYRGVGEGSPRGEEGTLEQWILKDEARNRVRAVPAGTPGAKRASTRWRVLGRREGRTLLELAPETGRPHQLRLAAATLGAPLAGDLKYGATGPLPDASVALHALELSLPHPTRGERLRFVDPPPATPIWEMWDRGS